MSQKIFLSFASEQKEAAENIALALRSRGFAVFFSHDDLPAGSGYDDRIEHAIAESSLLLFLVSPEAVTRGRYTLTELAFARAKWPNPNGRVLPVMLVPTPIESLPGYLKAVTLLEPEGNVAAETSAAVTKLLRPDRTASRARMLLPFLTFALASAIISYLSYAYAQNFLGFSFVFPLSSKDGISAVTILPGAAFGLALAACEFRLGLRDRFHLAIVVLFTMVGWVAAYDATASSAQYLSGFTKQATTPSAPAPTPLPAEPTSSPTEGQPAPSEEEREQAKQHIPVIYYLTGLVGGAVGGALTLFGLLIVNPGLRRFDQVMLIWVAATLSGALLGIVDQLNTLYAFLLLFGVWQGVFVALLVRAQTALAAAHAPHPRVV